MEIEKLFELAKTGDPAACNTVGDMYYDGDGVEQSYEQAVAHYNIAAAAGNVEAKYSLGYMYLYGEGVNKDVHTAVKYLEYAAERDHARANRHLGFLYFWGDDAPRDFERSFAYLKKAAELGDAKGQSHVAQCYEGDMWGAPEENLVLARKYYEAALAQNDEHAQWCIGINYHGGFHGYPVDYDKAYHYFKLAAENGSSKGQLNLALCYVNGHGVSPDLQQAAKWFEESANQGNKEAMGRLGMMLISGSLPLTKENTLRGYELLKVSAVSGDDLAAETLAEFEGMLKSWHATPETWTLTMRGCERESKGDGAQAVRLYQEAAAGNCTQAMSFLGSIYLRGMPGVAKNEGLSAQWLRRGAEAGNESAQCSLGISYLQGAGVPQSIAEAEKWLSRSADQGNLGAMQCLADIYADRPQMHWKAEQLYKQVLASDDLSENDRVGAKCSLGFLYAQQEQFYQAFPLLMEAANAGNELAQFGVGCCYYDGSGVQKSMDEAVRWWKKAAANGSQEAQDYLNKLTPGIQKYQTQSQNNSGQNGGCYVATAVYGSYDCPEVWTLRRYRDNVLAETWAGRVFIRLYYAISPTLVKWFGESGWFRNLCKPVLDRMVSKLCRMGFDCTPYHDRIW